MEMDYPSFRYDFSEFFGMTVTLWNGYSMNMVQFISTIIGILLGIMCYIFQAVALYSMAKSQGIKAPGIAWIPIINFYLLGKVADVIGKAQGRNTHRRVSLLVLHIILNAFSFGLLTYLPMVLDFLFQFMLYYNYYQPYVGNNSADPYTMVIAPALLAFLSAALILTLAIIYYVFLMRAVYIILKDRSPRNCGLMIVLCIFINYAIGPCLFAVRNKPSMAQVQLAYQQQQAQARAEAMARFQREQAAKAAAAQAAEQEEPSSPSEQENRPE